jgi:hypothetical protein
VIEAPTLEEARIRGAARLDIAPAQAVLEILEAPSPTNPVYTVLVSRSSAEHSLEEELLSIERRTGALSAESAPIEISPDAEKRLLDETLGQVDTILDATNGVDREMLRSIKDLTVALNPELSAKLDDLRLESLLDKTLSCRSDGTIDVQRNYTHREAYLKFRPPLEGGRALTIEDAERIITQIGAEPPPIEDLIRIIERVKRPRDGHITITVKFRPGRFEVTRTPDEMAMLLMLHPASDHGEEVTTEQIEERILEERIRFPLDLDAVRIALATLRKTKQVVTDVVIAAGKTPVDGKDATIAWDVPVEAAEGEGFQIIKDAGAIMVEKNRPLCRITPETTGTPGMTLSGKVLTARNGKGIRLECGPGVMKMINPDGHLYVATAEGRLALERNLILVRALKEATLAVILSQDLLTADLVISPGVGEAAPVLIENVLKAIEAKKIATELLDRDAIETAVAEANRERRVVQKTVARGRPFTPGKEGRIVFPFHNHDAGADLAATAGRIDHRERSAVQSVHVGETIAILTPTRHGEAGRNVLGAPIPPPALVEVRLEAGDGVRREGDLFIAERDGHLENRDGLLRVGDFFHVKGDVDMKSGNLRHHGAIIIDGDVNDGFTVESGGEIAIQGNLYAARIRAAGGLRIANGLIGKKKSDVRSESDLTARFIENGTVFALGNVEVTDYILQSDISAEKMIRITGEGASVIGGTLQAREGIEVGEAGASSAVPTVIRTGVSPRILEELRALEKNFRDIQNDVARLNQIEARFTGLNPNLTDAGKARTEIYARLVRSRFTLKKRLKEIGLRRVELHKELLDVPPAEITVRGALHPGVRIIMGETELRPNQKLEKIRFRYDAAAKQILMGAV